MLGRAGLQDQLVMSGHFSESFLIAEDGNISSLGNFDEVQRIYSDGFFICAAAYSVPASYQYINKEGKKLPVVFTSTNSFQDGRALVENGDTLKGYIDTTGELVIDGKNYKTLSDFSEQLALFQTNDNLYGYMDTNGAVVIQPQFISANAFKNGFARVRVSSDAKENFIDKNGNLLLKEEYHTIHDFSDGVAWAKTADSETVYLDTTGAVVIKPNLSALSPYANKDITK